jgi:hypothetical protein
MLLLENLVLDYEPYPIGIISPFVDASLYDQLRESYPPLERFKHMARFGNKYTLSDKWNPKEYDDFIRNTPVWREFLAYVKSEDFIYAVIDLLREHGIDLEISRENQRFSRRLGKVFKNLAIGRMPLTEAPIVARFEFSALPADGGLVNPHTDARRKLITLVFSMAKDGEWDASAGGGTEVLKPKDITKTYNFKMIRLRMKML